MCEDFLDSGLEATRVWGRCVKVVGYERGKDFKRLSAPYRLQFTTTFQVMKVSDFTKYTMINDMLFNLQCFVCFWQPHSPSVWFHHKILNVCYYFELMQDSRLNLCTVLSIKEDCRLQLDGKKVLKN